MANRSRQFLAITGTNLIVEDISSKQNVETEWKKFLIGTQNTFLSIIFMAMIVY